MLLAAIFSRLRQMMSLSRRFIFADAAAYAAPCFSRYAVLRLMPLMRLYACRCRHAIRHALPYFRHTTVITRQIFADVFFLTLH